MVYFKIVFAASLRLSHALPSLVRSHPWEPPSRFHVTGALRAPLFPTRGHSWLHSLRHLSQIFICMNTNIDRQDPLMRQHVIFGFPEIRSLYLIPSSSTHFPEILIIPFFLRPE